MFCFCSFVICTVAPLAVSSSVLAVLSAHVPHLAGLVTAQRLCRPLLPHQLCVLTVVVAVPFVDFMLLRECL